MAERITFTVNLTSLDPGRDALSSRPEAARELHATIALTLGSTLVLHRKFKPVTVLEDIPTHKVTAMVVVPPEHSALVPPARIVLTYSISRRLPRSSTTSSMNSSSSAASFVVPKG